MAAFCSAITVWPDGVRHQACDVTAHAAALCEDYCQCQRDNNKETETGSSVMSGSQASRRWSSPSSSSPQREMKLAKKQDDVYRRIWRRNPASQKEMFSQCGLGLQ